MKKKILVTLLSLVCVFACAFGLAACDFGGGNSHSHDYVQKYDKTYHWQECTNDGCNAKTKDRAAHSFGANNRCTVCGYEKGTAIIPDGDKLSVAGYSYVFSSVVVDCNGESETMYKYAEALQEQMSKSMEGATMAFFNDGTYNSSNAGETVKGTYTQNGAKVTVTINGETNQITATENSIVMSQFVPYGGVEEEKPETPTYPDEKLGDKVEYPEYSETENVTRSATSLSSDGQTGFTVTITYVKGTGGNKPITPEKPDDECKHIYDKYEPIDEYYHTVYCIKCGDNYKEMHRFGEDGNGDICFYCNYHKKDTPNIPDVPDTPDSVKYTLNSDGVSYSISKTSAFNETELIIPSQYNGKPVISIGDWAFQNCSSLKSITIPNSVTSIGYSAFDGCSALERINYTGDIASWCSVNNNLYDLISKVYIGNQKLQEMTNITIPDGITSIGNSAFSYCNNLTNITIPDGITSIGNSAFSYCNNLTNITIPDSVTSIGNSAFSYCNNLTNITIPDSVTRVGSYAFSGCNGLTSITIPSNLTYIGREAFSMCENLNTVYWNAIDCETEWADIQGEEARGIFYETDITTVIIGNGVINIRENAFYGCSSLTSIMIPDSVTSIGAFAFFDCSSLTSITFNGTIEQWRAIEKWNSGISNTGNYTVHCTDGDIAKGN